MVARIKAPETYARIGLSPYTTACQDLALTYSVHACWGKEYKGSTKMCS